MSRTPSPFDDEPRPPLNHPVAGAGADPVAGEDADIDDAGAPVSGSVLGDVEEQSADIEDGLLTMPLDVARESVLRWADMLRSLGDEHLDRVAAGLGELSSALDGPLEGDRIGTLLSRLGMDTRTAAADRAGPLGMALDRLADVLISAGQSLRKVLQ